MTDELQAQFEQLQGKPVAQQLGLLALALAKAQGELQHPKKTRTAGAGNYKYSYADLSNVIDAVKGPLSKNGLSVVQLPAVDLEKKSMTLTTILLHSSGQSVESSLSFGLLDTKPQTVGSAITYARRYALSALVGIASEEDDDAQTAQGAK